MARAPRRPFRCPRAYRGEQGTNLRSKGFPFLEQCRIFEVCTPQQAAAVLFLVVTFRL